MTRSATKSLCTNNKRHVLLSELQYPKIKTAQLLWLALLPTVLCVTNSTTQTSPVFSSVNTNSLRENSVATKQSYAVGIPRQDVTVYSAPNFMNASSVNITGMRPDGDVQKHRELLAGVWTYHADKHRQTIPKTNKLPPPVKASFINDVTDWNVSNVLYNKNLSRKLASGKYLPSGDKRTPAKGRGRSLRTLSTQEIPVVMTFQSRSLRDQIKTTSENSKSTIAKISPDYNGFYLENSAKAHRFNSAFEATDVGAAVSRQRTNSQVPPLSLSGVHLTPDPENAHHRNPSDRSELSSLPQAEKGNSIKDARQLNNQDAPAHESLLKRAGFDNPVADRSTGSEEHMRATRHSPATTTRLSRKKDYTRINATVQNGGSRVHNSDITSTDSVYQNGRKETVEMYHRVSSSDIAQNYSLQTRGLIPSSSDLGINSHRNGLEMDAYIDIPKIKPESKSPAKRRSMMHPEDFANDISLRNDPVMMPSNVKVDMDGNNYILNHMPENNPLNTRFISEIYESGVYNSKMLATTYIKNKFHAGNDLYFDSEKLSTENSIGQSLQNKKTSIKYLPQPESREKSVFSTTPKVGGIYKMQTSKDIVESRSTVVPHGNIKRYSDKPRVGNVGGSGGYERVIVSVPDSPTPVQVGSKKISKRSLNEVTVLNETLTGNSTDYEFDDGRDRNNTEFSVKLDPAGTSAPVRNPSSGDDAVIGISNETKFSAVPQSIFPLTTTSYGEQLHVTTASGTDVDYEDVGNGTSEECSNRYCVSYDEYMDIVIKSIYPTRAGWAFIVAHSAVFLIGLVGNALVCVAVYRNHSMRTVTNYFIVNLAIADFMVILFCLPPSVVWDVTGTWFLGEAMCKIVLYMQTVSVTVSILTLTFISIDRWYAICFPLKFKSTTGRAKTAILIIWLLALTLDIPELVVLTTTKHHNISSVYYTQCNVSWTKESDTVWTVAKMVILYALPLLFMSIAYCQIVRVLWRTDNMLQAPVDRHRHNNQNDNRGTSGGAGGTTPRRSTFLMNANNTTEGQLRSRRKAAKMLVAVVIMFAVCQFPVHLLSLLQLLIKIPPSDFNIALALLIHWLCYANSAVNPVIYNFMSGKFRREFRRAFAQCYCTKNGAQNQYQLSNYAPHATKTHFASSRQTDFITNDSKSAGTTRICSRATSLYQEVPTKYVRANSTKCTEHPRALANIAETADCKTTAEPKSIYRDVRRNFPNT